MNQKSFLQWISFVLAFVMVIMAIPIAAIAEGTEEQASSGKVDNIVPDEIEENVYTLPVPPKAKDLATSGDYQYSVTNGKATITKYTGAGGAVTIPSTLGGNPVISIGSSAFSGCTGLTSVTIPDSVTSIGDCAFRGCTGLTSITIPDSVTSIGSAAFYNCTGLAAVTYTGTRHQWEAISIGSDNASLTNANLVFQNENPANDYSYSVTGGKATITKFRGTAAAVSIPVELDGFPTVAIGSYAFSGCTGLTQITIPDSVTSIGVAVFSGCTDLTEISVSDGNATYYSTGNCIIETASKSLISGCKTSVIPSDGCVTSIGNYAFSSCKGLTEVTIPDSVTTIGYQAFQYCTKLTSVTIGNGVTSIGSYAFFGCTSLTSVTIGTGVTSIGSDAFSGCTGLTSITIPDSVTSIGYDAFSGCTGLTEITIPDSVTTIGQNAFSSCTGLTEITIPDSVTTIGVRAFSGCTGLKWVTIPDSATTIGSDAFSGCTKLTYNSYGNAKYLGNASNPYVALISAKSTSITSCKIHPNTKVIYGSAFDGCTWLTEVTIPDSVTSIGEDAFSSCSGLTSVTIPDSVTSIGYQAFQYCTKLTSVTIGNGVTTIGGRAFSGCKGLTSITIPDSVTSIGYSAFSGCTGLTEITIPDSVTTIGARAFSGCTGLTKITIPDGVTSIGDSAFSGCTGLTSVTIGNGVTSIGSYSFFGCTSLTSVTIGNGVTTIGDYAFYSCTGLTQVTIGTGVTSIGYYAFYGCTGLTKVCYAGSSSQWEKIAIAGGNDLLTNAFWSNGIKLGLTAERTVVRRGENLTIMAIIATNPGFHSLTVSPRAGEGLSLQSRTGRPQNGTVADTMSAGTAYTFTQENGATTETGTLVTFTVNVKEDALPGETVVTFDPVSLTDADGDALPISIAPLTLTIDVPAVGITLDHEELTMTTAEPAALCAALSPAEATPGLTWTVSDPAVLKITGNGSEVTLLGKMPGEAVVTVTAKSGVFATCAVTVEKVPVTDVTLNNTALVLTHLEQTAALTATVLPDTATYPAITWSSSDPAIVSVTGEGETARVTAHKFGVATITATADGVSAFCEVTVKREPVTAVTLSQETLELTLHEPNATLTANVLPDTATNPAVTWSSSDPAIVSVTGDGETARVTALTFGVATITATADGVSAFCEVTVSRIPVAAVTLNQETMTLSIQSPTGTLMATVTPSYATDPSLTWASSDPDVVSVSANGAAATLTGGALGVATVTVTSSNGLVSFCEVNMICNHVHTSHYEEIPATCTEEGWEAYTYCADCDRIIEGKDEEIPLIPHKVTQWTEAGSGHSGVCSVCGKTVAAGSHSGGTATCSAKAVCEICGVSYGELDPANHAGEVTEVAAVASTCTTRGHGEYVTCDDCGMVISGSAALLPLDKNNHVHKTGYPASVATCVQGGHTAYEVCNDCGAVIGYQATEIDPANHAGEVTEVAAVASTCATQGHGAYKVCTACGIFEGTDEPLPFNPANHTGKTTTHAAVASTCTTRGHTAYTTCDYCGMVISGSATLLPLDPTNHDWNEVTYDWNEDYTACTAARVCKRDPAHTETETANAAGTVTKKPTHTEMGETTYTTDAFTNPAFTKQAKTVANIPVLPIIWGDANGDGKVNTADMIRLKNYLAGVPGVEIDPGADANGDGTVNTADIIRLKNYLANYDYSTGTSGVTLGA